MGNTLFDSIVSKVAINIPMFAKSIVESGVEMVGANPFTVTPGQMKKALDEYILPKFNNFVSNYLKEEMLGGGVIRTNRENQIVSMNRTIIQYVESEGNPDTADLPLFTKLERLGLVMKVEEFAARGEDHVNRKINILEPHESVIDVTLILVTDAEGKPTGTISSLRDITLSEKLIEEVATLYEELEVRVQQRTAEIMRINKQLKESQEKLVQSGKIAAVGQLAAGVAHEIYNPLGIILGFAQILLQNMKQNEPNYMPLKSIEWEAVRCKKIVSDLLTFSREKQIEKEKISLNETIEKEIALLEPRAKSMNVTFVRNYGELPQILVNKNQMRQVIVNLSSNAIEAMPRGGEVTITTRENNGSIEFSVSDTGQGIPKEIRGKIFDPFFTTKEVGQGSGLGLSICYEIIQKHNATIDVESEVGKGSTFKITLPIKKEEDETMWV